jgi:hypothetical protein
MNKMTISVENSEAVAEIEGLMARFELTADEVVERVILEAGTWMPMELLAYPPAKRQGAGILSRNRNDEAREPDGSAEN